MIVNWLSEYFKKMFARDPRPRVVQCFDRHADFSDFLPPIESHVAGQDPALLAYNRGAHHGALWLKWAAEVGPGATLQVIIWLPFDSNDFLKKTSSNVYLDCLAEYLYSALTWRIGSKRPTLLAFLRRHGVPLPDGSDLDSARHIETFLTVPL